MNKNERLGIIMRRPLPSVAIRRALRGKPLDTRDLLATWATCEGCGLDFPPHALNVDTGLCAVCGGFDEQETDERADWCDGRREIESWLASRGL